MSVMSREMKVNLIMIVAGILVFLVGFAQQMLNKAFIESATPTSAYVTDVTKHRNTSTRKTGRSKYSYTAYITYTVDGVERNAAIKSGAASLSEGSTITVYYDPADPSDVRTTYSANYNTGFVGLLLVIVGIVGFVKAKKQDY